jgi:uncharacterized iron-regulated protein
MRRAAPLLALALAVTALAPGLAPGCASRPGAAPGHAPPSGAAGWHSPRFRDHPLVGRIWDVRGARWVDGAALAEAAARAQVLLLGETHDNVDHHLLQAWLVRSSIAAGRRPAIAFEMLGAHQQPDLDRALAHRPADARAAMGEVRTIWEANGWPDFDAYRPILEAALDASLPIVAANLPRDTAREVVRHGRAALPPGLAERLARDEPLPEAVGAALRKEMAESHCGELPDAMLDPMVLAQRARDAQMAERVEAIDPAQGGVLITGAGHARTDRGVPAHLVRDAPPRQPLAIAFLEVVPGEAEPAAYARDYGTDTLPFDYAVFTPAAEREDPCLALREHPKKMGAR